MKYLPLTHLLASGWLPSPTTGQLSLQSSDSGSDLLLQLWGRRPEPHAPVAVPSPSPAHPGLAPTPGCTKVRVRLPTRPARKTPGTRSPTPSTHPQVTPRLRWVSAAQESGKAPWIAKSAAPPRPGTFLPREVGLRETGGEVQILVRRVLAQPLVVRTTVTPKSRHLFERVRIAVATTGTFSHLV